MICVPLGTFAPVRSLACVCAAAVWSQVPWLPVLEAQPRLEGCLASVRTAPSLAFVSQRDRDRARELIQRYNGGWVGRGGARVHAALHDCGPWRLDGADV
jgi:hypothetical protein